MKMTGHKTRSIFDRYDIVSQRDLNHAARKLETLMVTKTVTVEDSSSQISPNALKRKHPNLAPVPPRNHPKTVQFTLAFLDRPP